MKKVLARPHFDPTLLSFLTLHERRLEESTLRSSSRKSQLEKTTLRTDTRMGIDNGSSGFYYCQLNISYIIGPKLTT